MIQQEYQLNETFNAYGKDDLLTSTVDTTWKDNSNNCRTLVGFRKEDGKFVPLGGELQYDTDTARLSGVWVLDKPHKVQLRCLGTTGGVTVKITEKNTTVPLGDDSRPYNNERTFT